MNRTLMVLACCSTMLVATASAQSGVSASVLLSSEEHRVDAGSGMVTASGWVPGAAAGLSLPSHLGIQVVARSGTLKASSGAIDDERIAEVSALFQVSPAGWVSFNLFGSARSVTTTLARQHWTTAGVGADLRMPLIGSATEGFLRVNVPVVVRVSGLANPNVAVEGGAGLRYRQGRVLGQLAYGLRRFDFPPASGRTRLEQISTLTLGVGLLFGR